MNLGREKLEWSTPLWHHIDQAVRDEAVRSEVASKFIPIRGPFPDALTVPADTINLQTMPMTIDEGSITPLIELWVEFALTQQQVDSEEQLSTAVSLATHAANMVSQAEDLVIFQGEEGTRSELIKKVSRRGPAGAGLLKAASDRLVEVEPVDGKLLKYGEQTFTGVAKALALLQANGHQGPYALAVHSLIYADTWAPLTGTLVMPADRIKPLVSQGYFGTGTLPESTGLLVSLGGNTLDLVVGVDPTTAFLQQDNEGLYHFRVFERFALRIKDPTALVQLKFTSGAA